LSFSRTLLAFENMGREGWVRALEVLFIANRTCNTTVTG